MSGNGMGTACYVCESAFSGAAWAQHAMCESSFSGTAWARHAMCELALRETQRSQQWQLKTKQLVQNIKKKFF